MRETERTVYSLFVIQICPSRSVRVQALTHSRESCRSQSFGHCFPHSYAAIIDESIYPFNMSICAYYMPFCVCIIC